MELWRETEQGEIFSSVPENKSGLIAANEKSWRTVTEVLKELLPNLGCKNALTDTSREAQITYPNIVTWLLSENNP